MNVLLSTILMMGAWVLAYMITTALHEFGHFLAAGGHARIYLHPFLWCWTYYNDGQGNPLLKAWGGVGFGALMAVLISAVFVGVPALRSVWFSPLILLGAAALAINGVYMVAGFVMPDGDGRQIVDASEQKVLAVVVVLVLGLVYLAVALTWMTAVLPLIGVGVDAALWRRFVVLDVGVLPHLLGMLVCHVIYNRRGSDAGQPWIALCFIVVGLGVMSAAAGLADKLGPVTAWMFPAPRAVGWAAPFVLLGVAVLAVIVEAKVAAPKD